jgi:hypothetical protein
VYVVRFSFPDREPSFRAFSARADALRWFVGAEFVICSEGSETVAALFEVPDEADAGNAIDAVKGGLATILDRYPVDGTPRRPQGPNQDDAKTPFPRPGVRERVKDLGLRWAFAMARKWRT